MHRVTQDLHRVTYRLSKGEVCDAIRNYLYEQHDVCIPDSTEVVVNSDGASLVIEYPIMEKTP